MSNTEKVLRVFEAPATFVKSVHNITGTPFTVSDIESRPAGASLPALGLSNKAISAIDIERAAEAHDLSNRASFTNQMSTPTSFTAPLECPPVETHLIQHTLWPESAKLYGHGYEVMSVACRGTVFASSCKATKSEYAAIRFWSSETWQQVGIVEAHSLTATSLTFSHSCTFLISVGRDRAWALYSCAKGAWQLVKKVEKAHARVIWDVCFTPCDRYFFTASRDKSVKAWTLEGDCLASFSFFHSVTALDIASSIDEQGFVLYSSRNYCLVVGLESGDVLVYRVNINKNEWTLVDQIKTDLAVNVIKFKPGTTNVIAAGGDGWVVGIYQLNL